MKSYTRAELEKLPKCIYSPFIPCTCENLPAEERARHRRCLSCALVGIQDALVNENLAGATLCYDSVLLVLKHMDVRLEL